MAKKYKLLRKQLVQFTNLTKPDGTTIEHRMYRIKALRDIPSHNVKAGDLGGWVDRREILSHDDDCWIGGEAKVFSYDSLPGVWISGNALITDQAIVYCQPKTGIRIFQNAVVADQTKIIVEVVDCIPRIHGDARLSGKAVARSPIEITGNISEEAKVVESTVLGAAQIMGNAIVADGSIISEEGVVTDEAKVSNAKIRGNATISGSARVEHGAVACDAATVTDHAVVRNAIIAGQSTVKDYAKILENGRILGKSIISGTTVTATYKDYRDYISAENPSIAAALPSRETPAGVDSFSEVETVEAQELRLKLDGLEKEINAYGNDIVKLLKFPIMTDLRDENTLEMMLALKRSKIIDPERKPDEFREAVDSLERKFMKAESNALIISSAAFSDEQSKKVDKARDLFAIACNEVSSEQEKKNAFKQGFRQLIGVVTITDSAVENMRIKVGIPELEA